MFVDGVLYSCVARNMAANEGTFWFPIMHQLEIVGLQTFHEQPPLGFFLESLFFRLFGDGLYTERLYTFTLLLCASMLIAAIWKRLVEDDSLRKMVWLPLFLWLLTPTVFWSYQHAILENTMVVFILLAVYFQLKTIHAEKKNGYWLVLAGVSIFLASLTKGVPGLFPCGFFVLYWLITRKISFKQALWQTSIVVLVPALIYVIILQFNAASESLGNYFFERLIGRVNDTPTVNSRMSILVKLFNDLLPMLLLFALWWIIAKTKKQNVLLPSAKVRLGAFMMSLGLLGSLPLMATKVQKAFYYTPAIPFFAIGIGILLAPGILRWISRLNSKTNGYRAALIISALPVISGLALSVNSIGKYSREETWIKDIDKIGAKLEEGTNVSASEFLSRKWSVRFYLDRYERIYINDKQQQDFLISTEKSMNEEFSEYKLLDLNTEIMFLYQRSK